MDALVTDSHHRSAVAGIRALSGASIKVLALGPRRSAAGLWSRHAAARALGPDSAEDPAGFVAALAGVAARHGSPLVYPGLESTLDALLASWPPPAGVCMPYSGADALRTLRDKRALADLAAAVGLTAPRILVEGTAGELAGSEPPVPAVLKRLRPGGAKARPVGSLRELRELLRDAPPDEPVILQELARPPLVGLALVLDRDGGVVARLQQHAHRTWPPAGGGSALAVSVAPDEDLVARSARLLAGAGYWGLAQLQFLQTDRGPALIDVNPRFYGSMPLALACGVNLPAAWHAVATDTAPPPLVPYRVGVSYRRLQSDLGDAVYSRSPRLLLTRAPRPSSGSVWAPDDPLPSALLIADALAIHGSRLARRLLAVEGPSRHDARPSARL